MTHPNETLASQLSDEPDAWMYETRHALTGGKWLTCTSTRPPGRSTLTLGDVQIRNVRPLYLSTQKLPHSKNWPLGMRVTKRSGSSWTGSVVGYYSTTLNPRGVCVESENEPGSVQIYPAKALRALEQADKAP